MSGEGASTYAVSAWLFLRLLAIVYGAAFLSLGVQIRGLVGSRGVFPAADVLRSARRVPSPRRYLVHPTIFWLGAGDGALAGSCAAGVALSVALLLGAAPVPILVCLWLLYLSLITVCDVFLGYQWDVLLVETGFLAIWMAPLTVSPHWPAGAGPSALARGLVLWLLFRLMVSSGAAKLLSGDTTWRRLTALQVHYETQPLPTTPAWFAHRLPASVHRASALVMFAVELFAPLFLLVPGPPRTVAATAITGFMVLIMVTGNYGFFNPLTIALCVPLLPDSTWRFLGQPLVHANASAALDAGAGPLLAVGASHGSPLYWPWWAVVPAAVLVLALSLQSFAGSFGMMTGLPSLLRRLLGRLQSLRIVNGYGLFAVMTTTRREIVLEGSRDGATWTSYEPRWKPGDVRRRPRFTGLHMPRLDWQLWFAALGDPRFEPFLGALVARLREGSPAVLRLFRSHPPHAEEPTGLCRVRVRVYRYRFTSFQERRETGAWWLREELRVDQDADPGVALN